MKRIGVMSQGLGMLWFAAIVSDVCKSKEVERRTARVVFENRTPQPIEVFFVPPGGKYRPQYKDTILPADTGIQDSRAGHTFQIRIQGFTTGVLSVESSGTVRCELQAGELKLIPHWHDEETIRRSLEHLKGPKWDLLVETGVANCTVDYKGYPDDAVHFCNPAIAFSKDSGRLRSQFEFDETAWKVMLAKRHDDLRSSLAQRRSLHRFTDLGFEIHDTPADLQETLKDYWQKFRTTRSKLENRDHLDPNLSCRESDTWVLPVDWSMKKRVEHVLAPIIAAWAKVDVEILQRTAIFGLRLYHKNAVLHMHLDRPKTHVLSAILEVGYLDFRSAAAEEEISERWPLHIRDHHGQLHYLPNRPGQLILYESATCQHGRPSRFLGRESAHLFIHFAPQGWPERYPTDDNVTAGTISADLGRPAYRQEL